MSITLKPFFSIGRLVMANPVTILIVFSAYHTPHDDSIFQNSISKEVYSPRGKDLYPESFVVILTFRNEAGTIGDTLPILINEAALDGNCRLIMVDSDSNDNG